MVEEMTDEDKEMVDMDEDVDEVMIEQQQHHLALLVWILSQLIGRK